MWTFCMIKVLIGLSLGLCLFFVFVVFSIGIYLGRGPVGPQLEPPLLPKGRAGRMGRTVCAELRPVLLGLSDFASKGERRDAHVCKEGPSVRGSAKGPVFRDPCSFRGSFSFHLPLLC